MNTPTPLDDVLAEDSHMLPDAPGPDERMQPCPECPDGQVWDAHGPTGEVCPRCNGYARV